MERLTFDGNFCDISQCRELPCPYNTACTQRQVWEKLKAYENTGLTPEEVNDVMAKAKLASAVAPVVHGRWEAKGYVCGESEFECSVCHKTEWRTSISRFRWCPFCGARMDGDSNG